MPTQSHVALFTVACGLKLLLLPSYRSTDFEVHRGWMAITSSLPLSQWYVDETSEWTLDYPPLFAWFEKLLALGAPLFDAEMLRVSATPYDSAGTNLYMRLTVIFTDALLLVGSSRLAYHCCARADRRFAAVALTFLNAGLLLVDHVHFQYNGMLIGLLLLSCSLLVSGRHRLAAGCFAALLMLKHLFLFAAPLFFVQLLRNDVLRSKPLTSLLTSSSAIKRLLTLGMIVICIFGLTLGPFLALGQSSNLLQRLFPFGRGLTHAYWAPNVWALYTFADRIIAAAAARVLPVKPPPSAPPATAGGVFSLLRSAFLGGGSSAASAAASAAISVGGTSGKVGETAMAILPSVGAGGCAVLVVLSQAPLLFGVWRRPDPTSFAPALAYCGLAAFLFGYHVHEKAILPPLLLLTSIEAPASNPIASDLHERVLLLLSVSGHYALLPLLYQPAEWALSRLLPLAYHCALLLVIQSNRRPSNKSKTGGGLRSWEVAYLFGFAPLELFASFVHPLLLAPRLPFLPLMLTSVYCAIGVVYATGLTYLMWACWSSGEDGKRK